MIPNRPRDPLPDSLRALALLSVLVVNALGYAAAPWGPTLGQRSPADGDAAALVQGLVAALLYGKGYPILAFVFGMALWLAAHGRARPEALRRGTLRQRLLGLGVLHGALLYFGDILTLYALVGQRLLRRLHAPWRSLRRQLWFALGWAVLAKLALVAVALHLADRPPSVDAASLSSVQTGWQFLKLNGGAYILSQFIAIVLAAPLLYLCMLAGVAAARLRLLSHRRWRPMLQRGLLRAGVPLLLVSLAYGWGCAMSDPSGVLYARLEAVGYLVDTPLAAAYIAALALLSSGGRAAWCRWVEPLGQRTLTLYVGHSLPCLLLFSGLGWALKATTVQMLLFSLGLWLLALAAAALSGKKRWPLEAWMARR
ncbi:DUF418 domain-containing protein [Hydrogenophaga palleronii]|uniref:DUF418 domain-containing protein n=1 Tax=Hydrogenophaga palleronii TaxID=65655 RepID=UPI00082460C4|nr:DUF418 domain-containing protein [Hydrogenophaga palleronii]